MRKLFLVIFILFIGFTTAHTNPMDNVPGVVSFSETVTVYFDTEENAVKMAGSAN